MLGDMLEGLLRVLFRVWTIGVFYFINNRFLSWLNDSMTSKMKYHKLPKSEEERIIQPHKDKDSELYSLPSTSFSSWNNWMFINLLNSKNQSISWSQVTSMFSSVKTRQIPRKDNCRSSSLVISWDIPCSQSQEKVGTGKQELHSNGFSKTMILPQCPSRHFICEDCLFGGDNDKEREKQEGASYSKQDHWIMSRAMSYSQRNCIYQEQFYPQKTKESLLQMDCSSTGMFSHEGQCKFCTSVNKGNFCTDKVNMQTTEKNIGCFWPDEMHCSFKDVNYEDYRCHNILFKEVEEHSKMDTFCQEENICSKEAQCSSAASIDSGFQSFCSINTTYTCLDVNGTILYISNISHNNEGKIVAMDVGFSAADSSEESIFSDEDEGGVNESMYEEEDLDCCNSDEEYIVFDTGPCPTSETFCPDSVEGITVEVNLPYQTFEVQISQTLSPNANYFCNVNIDECGEQLSDCDDYLKSEFDDTMKMSENSTDSHSAGTVGTKKVQFNSDIEVHKFITWEYAYRQARLGPWKDLATDRLHFKRRIGEVQKVLEPVLLKKIVNIDV